MASNVDILAALSPYLIPANRVNTTALWDSQTNSYDVWIYQIPGTSPTVYVAQSSGAIDCDGKQTSNCSCSTCPGTPCADLGLGCTDSAMQEQTSFQTSGGDQLTADALPYFVLPVAGSSYFDYSTHGIAGGQCGMLLYGTAQTYAVFGDEAGDPRAMGEMSYKAAQNIGINPNPSSGGVSSGVTYIIFSGAENVVSPIESTSQASTVGSAALVKMLNQIGGSGSIVQTGYGEAVYGTADGTNTGHSAAILRILTGGDTYYDASTKGVYAWATGCSCSDELRCCDIKCDGHVNQECTNFIGPDFSTWHLYATGCYEVISTGKLQIYEYNYTTATWDLVSEFNFGGGSDYYWERLDWTDWTGFHYMKAVFTAGYIDPATGVPTPSYFYINAYNLTVNVKDIMGDAIGGVTVYVDGFSRGTTDSSGNISYIVGPGSHVIRLGGFITCAGKTWDEWTGSACSWSVNVTGDMTQNVTMCMANDCRTYNNFKLYINPNTPEYFYPSCDGTSSGGSLWGITGLICNGASYNTLSWIHLVSVASGTPNSAVLHVYPPWYCPENWEEITVQPYTLYDKNNVPGFHSATYGDFSFKTGNIFAGSPNWVEIDYVCWTSRNNYCPGTVDTLNIYVDCLNGDDTRTGLCNFANAVKTITHAMTLVGNGGRINIKYGDCLNEDLDAIFNPPVNTVELYPVQDEYVNGTGQVTISGT